MNFLKKVNFFGKKGQKIKKKRSKKLKAPPFQKSWLRPCTTHVPTCTNGKRNNNSAMLTCLFKSVDSMSEFDDNVQT